jgi:hypothetical protein
MIHDHRNKLHIYVEEINFIKEMKNIYVNNGKIQYIISTTTIS